MPPKNLSLAFGNSSWSNPEGMREMNLTLLVGSCADPFTNIYDGVNKMLVASAFIPKRKFTLSQGMLAVPKGIWMTTLDIFTANGANVYVKNSNISTARVEVNRGSVCAEVKAKESDETTDPPEEPGCFGVEAKECAEIQAIDEKIYKLMGNCPALHNKVDPNNFIIPPWIKQTPPSPETLGGGDIIRTAYEAKLVLKFYQENCNVTDDDEEHNARHRRMKRQLLSGISLWPVGNNGGKKLQIAVSKEVLDIDKWTAYIAEAIKYIHSHTCIRFTEDIYAPGEGVIVVTNKKDVCQASVGQQPTHEMCKGTQFEDREEYKCQNIILGESCLSNGIIVHEMMHSLGILHEQSRMDSRQHADFNEGPVPKEYVSNFYIYPSTNFGMPYDFGSLMHYGAKDYNFKDPKSFVLITRPRIYQHTIGQRDGLSFKDANLVNLVYCKCPNAVECRNDGYQDPNKCNQCVCPLGFTGGFCDKIDQDMLCTADTEFVADWQPRTLKPKIKFPKIDPGYSIILEPMICLWKIKPKQNNQTVRLRIKKLEGFSCEQVCSKTHHVEIKYMASKISTGAQICCQEELENSVNWLDAEKPGIEVFIFLKYIGNLRVSSPPQFELTYETDENKFVPGCKCPSPGILWKTERNPGQALMCGEKPCDDTEPPGPQCGSLFFGLSGCTGYFLLNGHLKVKEPSNHYEFLCMKREGRDESFWVWWKDKSVDPLPLDEIKCYFE